MDNIKIINGLSANVVKFHTFSDGTETCKIPLPLPTNKVQVQVDIKDATMDLMRLALVKDAIDRNNPSRMPICLYLTYMPQARADRVFEAGQPHALKVFANILNSLNFHKVYIKDPHSDVTAALVNNLEVVEQEKVVRDNLYLIEEYLGTDYELCAPDLGAAKKIFDVAKAIGKPNYIQAIKIRDVTTGNIVKCDVLGDNLPEKVLIVDDISDGGASFKFLAMKLKEKGVKKVALFVTHGIFSASLEVLSPAIDYIFVDSLVSSYVNRKNITNYNEFTKEK